MELTEYRKTVVQLLGYKDYQDYLSSDKWYKRKIKFSKIHYIKCYVCSGEKDCVLHHLSYKNIGDEKDDELIWLCREHHEEIHDYGRIMLPKQNAHIKLREKYLLTNNEFKRTVLDKDKLDQNLFKKSEPTAKNNKKSKSKKKKEKTKTINRCPIYQTRAYIDKNKKKTKSQLHEEFLKDQEYFNKPGKFLTHLRKTKWVNSYVEDYVI